MGDYRVRFEVFEGPLDLLLYLIRRQEVDIYEVNLTRIAAEFVEYLNLMRELDLDVAGEFVVMAATLMLIKSRELLPRDQRPENQTSVEDEVEDPRWELIRQLVEYRKFKDAAARLHELEVRAENVYPRDPGRIELPEDTAPRRQEASLFDLLGAVNAVLRRVASRTGEARDMFEDKWTVSEKIESLLTVIRDRGRLRFSELFHATTSRAEVVVTFLALLELVRLRSICAFQPAPFAEIEIEPATVPVPSSPGLSGGLPPPEPGEGGGAETQSNPEAPQVPPSSIEPQNPVPGQASPGTPVSAEARWN